MSKKAKRETGYSRFRYSDKVPHLHEKGERIPKVLCQDEGEFLAYHADLSELLGKPRKRRKAKK